MEYNTVVPPTSFTNNTQQDKEKYFRQYINGEKEAVCNHYRIMRKNQTYDYNIKVRQKYASRQKEKLTLWQMLDIISKFIDISDPDISLSNVHHLFQAAEKARADGQAKWFQLTCLLHDMGKIMCKWGCDEDGTSMATQWGIVGDTFIVGCRIPDTCVYPEFNITNPDMSHPIYSTHYGIYENKCGLNNTICAWGHDEYLYQVLKDPSNSNKLPKEAYYMIRFHSLYPWHNKCEYYHLMNDEDEIMLPIVQEFNKYDLYTKVDTPVDINNSALLNYYYDLFKEFFPSGGIWF